MRLKIIAKFGDNTQQTGSRAAQWLGMPSYTEPKGVADLFKDHYKVSLILGSADQVVEVGADMTGNMPLLF